MGVPLIRSILLSARSPRRILGVGAMVLWAIALCSGVSWLWAYESLPGRQGPAPASVPLDPHAPARYQLIVFIHPHCPCSRSTLGELARLMAQVGQSVSARVLFVCPKGNTDWAATDLWKSAAAIPGVRVEADEDGAQAHRFSAETSGQALLYGPTGKLLFAGGITASRGHAGDNIGESDIVSLVQNSAPASDHTPVFGCPLFGDAPGQLSDKDSQCHK